MHCKETYHSKNVHNFCVWGIKYYSSVATVDFDPGDSALCDSQLFYNTQLFLSHIISKCVWAPPPKYVILAGHLCEHRTKDMWFSADIGQVC